MNLQINAELVCQLIISLEAHLEKHHSQGGFHIIPSARFWKILTLQEHTKGYILTVILGISMAGLGPQITFHFILPVAQITCYSIQRLWSVLLGIQKKY
jgi:hypothetical protein